MPAAAPDLTQGKHLDGSPHAVDKCSPLWGCTVMTSNGTCREPAVVGCLKDGTAWCAEHAVPAPTEEPAHVHDYRPAANGWYCTVMGCGRPAALWCGDGVRSVDDHWRAFEAEGHESKAMGWCEEHDPRVAAGAPEEAPPTVAAGQTWRCDGDYEGLTWAVREVRDTDLGPVASLVSSSGMEDEAFVRAMVEDGAWRLVEVVDRTKPPKALVVEREMEVREAWPSLVGRWVRFRKDLSGEGRKLGEVVQVMPGASLYPDLVGVRDEAGRKTTHGNVLGDWLELLKE